MLYTIATVVNRHKEFRTTYNAQGEPGVYDEMHPCYTVFHKDSETFSNLWTAYTPDYYKFCQAYQQDMKLYGDREGTMAKPDAPENTFPVSMIHWAIFEGFNFIF